MMTAEDKTYNGWHNYETWSVKLWMDNEQSSSVYWSGAAQECWDEAADDKNFTRDDRAMVDLMQRLKDEHEEAKPDVGCTLWADLLNSALSEVNWREIAVALLDDVKKDA